MCQPTNNQEFYNRVDDTCRRLRTVEGNNEGNKGDGSHCRPHWTPAPLYFFSFTSSSLLPLSEDRPPLLLLLYFFFTPAPQ